MVSFPAVVVTFPAVVVSFPAVVVSSPAVVVSSPADVVPPLWYLIDDLDNDVTIEGLLSLLESLPHVGVCGLQCSLQRLKQGFLHIGAGGIGQGHDLRADGGHFGAGWRVNGNDSN